MRTRFVDIDDRMDDLADRMRADPDLGEEFLARYEISWRLCAARCLDVQNSLVNVLTCTGAPASLVSRSRSVAVALP